MRSSHGEVVSELLTLADEMLGYVDPTERSWCRERLAAIRMALEVSPRRRWRAPCAKPQCRGRHPHSRLIHASPVWLLELKN